MREALRINQAARAGGSARSARGFTLIEALVVVALVALLLSFALPAGSLWLQRQRLGHAAELLLSDLHLARSEAVHGARNILLRITETAAGTCYVIHSGPVNGCLCALAGPPSCLADAQALKQAQWPRRSGYPNLLSNVPTLLFSGRQGTVSLAATLRMATQGIGEVTHVVSITGRIRSCAADGSFMRWPACEGQQS